MLFVLPLVNDETSPLAQLVDAVLPLRAGKELAVAATKSYLATLSALLQLTAYWKQDAELIKALDYLPDMLNEVIAQPVQLTRADIEGIRHCVVLGRGFGYAIGREIALKLKEVCGLHAEAFSSAEFLHGPVTLVENELSIISIELADEAAEAHQHIISDVRGRGAKLTALEAISPNTHARFLPLAVLQRFYLDVEQIAVNMGLDPDQPAGLKKVTQTL